jgi:hypothetical protein
LNRTALATATTPNIKAPRFKLAQIAANSVLKELGFPRPPIPLHEYFQRRDWRVCYEDLDGADGFMVKVPRKSGNKFVVVLGIGPKDNVTVQRRQYFTWAHELGHILLHGHFILDSESHIDQVPDHVADIMEVEAHWFASRLLMPNYVFESITDLIPEHLAEKCKVNLTPASKRIKGLENSVRTALIQSARLDKWPKHEEYVLKTPTDTNDWQLETWDSFQQVAASSQLLYICKKCSLLHTEKILWGKECQECGGPLVKIDGIL